MNLTSSRRCLALALTLAGLLLAGGGVAQGEGAACAPGRWPVAGGVVVNAERRWIEAGFIRFAGGLCVETGLGEFTGRLARYAPGAGLLEIDEADLKGLPAATRLTAQVARIHLATGELTLAGLTLTLGESRLEANAGRLTGRGGLELPGDYRGASPDWRWTGTTLTIDLTTGTHQGEQITMAGGPPGDPLAVTAARHTGTFTGPELDLADLQITAGRLTFISSGGSVRGGGFNARGIALTSCVCPESPALLFLAEYLEVVPGVERIVLRDTRLQVFGVTVARPGPFLGIDLSAIAALLPEAHLQIEPAGVRVILRDLKLGSDESGRLTADLGVTGLLGQGSRPEVILRASGRVPGATYQFSGGLSRPGAVLDARLHQPLGESGFQLSALASATHPTPSLSPTLRFGVLLEGRLPAAPGLELRPALQAEIASQPRVDDALAGAALGLTYRAASDGLTFTFDAEAGGRVYARAPSFAWGYGRAGVEWAVGAVKVTASYALRRGLGQSPFTFDARPPLQELGFAVGFEPGETEAGLSLTFDLDGRHFHRLVLTGSAALTPWEALTLRPRLGLDLPALTFVRYGLGVTVRTCCFEIRADAGYERGEARFTLNLGLRR